MRVANLLTFRHWTLEGLSPPWKSQSLHSLIQAQGGKVDLPEPKLQENEIRWIAGAMDGVSNHHEFIPSQPATSERRHVIVTALERLLKRATEDTLAGFAQLLPGESLIVDTSDMEALVRSRLLRRYKQRIAAVGRLLATHSDERETTKFGLLLVKLAGNELDRDILETLATHDEFTFFAAQALAALVSTPEQTLWNVAKRVHGWGRIQVVEQLRGTDDKQIQHWMLRDGFRNDVMDEYLAGLCAMTGRLHEALRSEFPDPQLFDGAADILKALVCGGPAESMDDYPDARQSIREYLRHVANCPDPGLRHLLCLARLQSFFAEDEEWKRRFSAGWNAQERAQFLWLCTQQMQRPVWAPHIELGLRSDDNTTFYEADAGAKDLGISTWAIHFARVRIAPTRSTSWYRLLEQTDETQIDEVLNFAQSA